MPIALPMEAMPVNLAVKHLVAEEFVGILHIIVIADWFKISTKFTLVDSGRNHADVAPVTAGQPCGHIVCIVGNAFKADGDIWIQLLKFLCIFFKGGVYQVCPVGDHFQVCLQVRISRFQIDALVIQGSIFVCGVGAVAAVAAPQPVIPAAITAANVMAISCFFIMCSSKFFVFYVTFARSGILFVRPD